MSVHDASFRDMAFQDMAFQDMTLPATQLARLARAMARTDEIHGRWPDPFTPALACRIATNMGVWLRQRGHSRLVIGHDGRKASLELFDAMRPFFGSYGFVIFDGGLMASPAASLTMAYCEATAALLVTAAHLPLGYAGLKLLEQVEAPPVSVLQRFITDEPAPCGEWWHRPYQARRINSNAAWQMATTIPRLRHAFVLDAMNGAAGPLLSHLPDLERRTVHLFNHVPLTDFGGKDPDPAAPSNRKRLTEEIQLVRAQLGFAFDGSASRCLVLDAEGREVEPDMIACLFMRLAPDLVRSGIAVDIKASALVGRIADEAGIPAMRVPTGQAHMRQAIGQGAAFGVELSGHFSFAASRRFDDGPFAALQIARLCDRDPAAFRQTLADLRRMHRVSPEYRLPFADIDRDTALHLVQERATSTGLPSDQSDGIRLATERGHVLVRASKTEDVLSVRYEGVDDEAMVASGAVLRDLIDGLVTPNWTLPKQAPGG